MNDVIKKYISVTEAHCEQILTEYIRGYILDKKGSYGSIAVFCIGTDRATGDSLGPLVGTSLCELGFNNVVGTMQSPVHAINIREKVDILYKRYDNPLVIAIDACLGFRTNIGDISVWDGPVRPGLGVFKDLISVGDIAITGTVNKWSLNGLAQLQTTRLSLVMNMSRVIAYSIFKALS